MGDRGMRVLDEVAPHLVTLSPLHADAGKRLHQVDGAPRFCVLLVSDYRVVFLVVIKHNAECMPLHGMDQFCGMPSWFRASYIPQLQLFVRRSACLSEAWAVIQRAHPKWPTGRQPTFSTRACIAVASMSR
eukprot:6465515-Amphidinium_carterae.1